MAHQPLIDWLARQFPTAKRQTLRRMIAEGRVTLNGNRANRASQPVGAKDDVQVTGRRIQPPPALPDLAPLRMVHEDADILVIDKPAGLLTSTVPREKRPTALAIIRNYLAAREPGARVGLIHRLDRDASGLLVFSKNNSAYESLKGQFFKHAVERIYLAVVHGSPGAKTGRIESRLIEHHDGHVYCAPLDAKGQRAITEFEVLARREGKSILRIRLQTGRKHQIRAHLAERGCPVVGDNVYGENDAPRLMLAAVQLGLTHPASNQRMDFRLPIPVNAEQFFDLSAGAIDQA